MASSANAMYFPLRPKCFKFAMYWTKYRSLWYVFDISQFVVVYRMINTNLN